MKKKCSKCGIEKSFDEFFLRKGNSKYDFGYRNDCKLCCNIRNKSNQLKDREGYLKRCKDYYQKNKVISLKKSKELYDKNTKDKIQIKKCIICGKEFKTKRDNMKHCGNIKCWKKMKKDYLKKYGEENREKLKVLSKIWRNENKEILKDRYRKYYLENKEKVKERCKIWIKNNKNKKYEMDKLYRIRNNKRIRKNQSDWVKKRKLINPEYKILVNYRNRIYCAIKRGYKSDSTKKLLGADIDFIKEYLENKFNKGMTWDNYGSYWQIDHKIPCNWFDLSKEEEQCKCFHYTNLQPLLSSENASKRDNVAYSVINSQPLNNSNVVRDDNNEKT